MTQVQQAGNRRWHLLPTLLLPVVLSACGSAVAVRSHDPLSESVPEAVVDAPFCIAVSDGIEAMPPDAVAEQLAPLMASYLSAPPHPAIHGRARVARVPIIMYHDILAQKEVFFDLTPEEFEADLQLIRDNGLTPISLDQLVLHLRTGMPLPEKPILLTFDDGYAGHYTYVFPLLKEYGYPGLFSIYTSKVGENFGRSSLSWDELREMAQDPLITIASHSVTHPSDLTEFDGDLRQEVFESKQILEAELEISIDHFVYPVGHYDDEVKRMVQEAGYTSALTMDDDVNKMAGESADLFTLERIGQSQLEDIIPQAYEGPPLPTGETAFNFTTPITKQITTFGETELVLISGGQPKTIHADSRYQVPEIIRDTEAIAAVDGGFFSLKYLDSNTMIGPVMGRNTGSFVPGNASENRLLAGRPLVLLSETEVRFVSFDPARHGTLEGVQAEMPDLTDVFVSAAWLVKDGVGRSPADFGTLFDYDANRHRAFWGINQAGQPVIGVTRSRIDSVSLGQMLAQAGMHEAVMLDSGASTSLAYEGESLVYYTPRPVPHVVALYPPVESSPSAQDTMTSAVASSEAPSCVEPIQSKWVGEWLRWANRIAR
ncbi:polysaccharide deacetylase family protein [Vacuolonema iberomarrocanum]|uniref:polysaccharide deacetylase family protein n=1 Tax=Vacuolonema iberomarrocanum TaxID=3454632 RepID=UPI0019FDF15A|nr:polysaccharide deacetylase family protein [filamentous cyanobacterium LEGE 07170]